MSGTVTELPKKRGKKPAEKPMEAENSAPEYVKPSTKPFPPWPKGNGRGGYCKPEELFGYWDALPPEFIARTNFYVNREHPKLDRLQELTDEQRAEINSKKRRPPAKYIDKISEPWRESDLKMAFLKRYGSGEYKIWLNDAGVGRNVKDKDPDITSRNLCRTLYSVWDSDFPPILDPSRPDKGIGILDWTHAANASYVTELRMKGVLPPGTKEESEVDNNVVKTLADQVSALANKVGVQETDRLVERIAEKVNPSGNGSVASTIVDVMRAAKEMNPPAPAAAVPAVDPMDRAFGMMREIMTVRADNPMVEIMKEQLRASNDNAEKARQREADLQKELRDQLRANMNDRNQGGIETWIEKLDKLAPKLQSLLGLGGEKLTEVVHGRKRSIWEELAMQAIPPLAQGFAPVIPLIANRFLGPPTAGPGLNGTQQPATNGAQPGQPQQLPAANDPMQALKIKVGNFLGANVAPMQKYFTAFVEGKREDVEDPESVIDGWTFASWIYEGHGPQILAEARQLGTATITQMFQASPYWTAIQPHAAKFAEFLDQVLRYEPPAPEQPGPVDLTKEPLQ